MIPSRFRHTSVTLEAFRLLFVLCYWVAAAAMVVVAVVYAALIAALIALVEWRRQRRAIL